MSTRYTFIVRGRLPEIWTPEFEHLTVHPLGDGTTALEGPVRDQSCLYGHIRRMEGLGLCLISAMPTEMAGRLSPVSGEVAS